MFEHYLFDIETMRERENQSKIQKISPKKWHTSIESIKKKYLRILLDSKWRNSGQGFSRSEFISAGLTLLFYTPQDLMRLHRTYKDVTAKVYNATRIYLWSN